MAGSHLPRINVRSRTSQRYVAPCRRSMLAGCLVASLALIGFGPSWVPGSFAPNTGKRDRGLVQRHAEADVADSVDMDPPAITEADVYELEVDVLTGEVDTSSLPMEAGVYAVFDKEDAELQYIGLSRFVQKSVQKHCEAFGAEAHQLVSAVHVLEMREGSKEELKGTWERWIRDYMESGGSVPPGNLPENIPGAEPRWRGKLQQADNGKPLALGDFGVGAMESVKRAVEESPIVLFMKGTPVMPQCGFSARTVGILRQIGVPYQAVNVLDDEANPGVREAVKEFSSWPTIPQLFVTGSLVGGADIVAEMHDKGELTVRLELAAAGAGGDTTEQENEGSEASSGKSAATKASQVALIDDPKRPVASLLTKTLDENFELYDLKVVDETSLHEGDAGALEMGLTSESHFTVEIVASDFEGLSPVDRQKRVYTALSDVMPRIHALSLVTRTPSEAA